MTLLRPLLASPMHVRAALDDSFFANVWRTECHRRMHECTTHTLMDLKMAFSH